jgi:hypothetical protein
MSVVLRFLADEDFDKDIHALHAHPHPVLLISHYSTRPGMLFATQRRVSDGTSPIPFGRAIAQITSLTDITVMCHARGKR